MISFLNFRPVNMLDSYENRFGHAAAFGVTSVYCIKMLFGSVKSILGSDLGVIIDQSPSFVSSKYNVMNFCVGILRRELGWRGRKSKYCDAWIKCTLALFLISLRF